MMIKRIALLGVISSICPSSIAFLSVTKHNVQQQQQQQQHRTQYTSITNIILEAKGGAKKKKSQKSAGGGFGKVVERKGGKKKSEDDGDYAAFPALQEKVKSTLIPSDPLFSTVGQELPPEIIDRIEQIYGFKDFNYPNNNEEVENGNDFFLKEEVKEVEEKPISFNELLSTSSSNDDLSSSSSSTTKNEFSDLLKPKSSTSDFSDLIASATGADTTKTNDSGEELDISNLKPFSKFRVLHVDPMVLAVDDFLTDEECDKYVDLCNAPKKRTSNNDMPMMSRSKTVGKDSLAKAQRTSTTWFHHFKSVPELLTKATRLLGLNTIHRWEEPQTVRYQQSEKFSWHLDALAPSDNLNDMGGQRVATLLVYLTDIGENNGGATVFRDLGGENEKYLTIQPKKGSALLFFPAAGNIPNTPFDVRTLHAGEALSNEATQDKWIAQMWLREYSNYQPTAPPGNTHAAAADAINEFCQGKN